MRQVAPLSVMLCLLAFAATALCQTSFTARVVGITDGDTITVLTADNTQIKIRLAEIDAPESKQPFGTASKQALSRLVFGRQVVIHPTGQDRYKRTLAVVMDQGTDINWEMVRLGMAWRYERYSKNPRLLAAQQDAQRSKRGLWKDAHPIPPWDWRKR